MPRVYDSRSIGAEKCKKERASKNRIDKVTKQRNSLDSCFDTF